MQQPTANAPTPHRSEYDPYSDLVAPRHLPKVIGVSTTTAWRLRVAGDFPLAVRVSRGRIAYVRSELLAWRETRRETR